MSDVKKLLDEREQIISKQRKMLDRADAEGREFTTDESNSYTKMEMRFSELTHEINSIKALSKRKAIKPIPQQQWNREAERDEQHGDAETRALDAMVRGQEIDYRDYDDLNWSKDVKGGFLVTGNFRNEVIEKIRRRVYMRQLCRVETIETGDGISFPYLKNRPADPTFTSELHVPKDQTTSFEKINIFLHALAEYVLISADLRDVVGFDILDYMSDQLAYKFGVKEENAFLTGNGAGQPIGVMVASDQGISTDRDVSTSNTSSEIKADGLINALYSLEEGYQKNATWIFHRDAVKMIRKLKDGQGNYLWRAGIASDKPDTILDKPYKMSEYMSNTFSSAQYVGIIGDFKMGYMIVQNKALRLQVSVDRYIEQNLIMVVGRQLLGGGVLNEDAFARVKLAT